MESYSNGAFTPFPSLDAVNVSFVLLVNDMRTCIVLFPGMENRGHTEQQTLCNEKCFARCKSLRGKI